MSKYQYLFIGLGQMGYSMAKNIEKNVGIQSLFVHDIDHSKMKSFQNSIYELQKVGCGIIFTMLPNDAALNKIIESTNFIDRLPVKSKILDFSTTSPGMSRRLREYVEAKGHSFIDSPVSGGIDAAKTGKLTLLMGCDESETSELKEVLGSISSQQFFLRKRGLGIIAKLCNNFVLMCNMVGVSESLELGRRNGIPATQMENILKQCSGQSWVISKYSPVRDEMISNDYNIGFKSSLALKDLELAEKLFIESSVPSAIVRDLCAVYEKLVQDGYQEKDFGVYFKVLSTLIEKHAPDRNS